MNNSIEFDITIYEDALSLLLSDRMDIRAEIISQLYQDDHVLDEVNGELYELCEENGFDADRITDTFAEVSPEKLMDYITFSEAGITFDYSESQACCDLRCVAFKILCTFDVDKYLKEE